MTVDRKDDMEFSLAHQIVTAPNSSPTKTAFVLHGIFGSGRNWRTFALDWVRAKPDWRAVLVDLRCHGRSVGAPPPHDLAACAADLARLGERLGAPPECVIGHSFGGKVALVYAREHGAALEDLWSLDSPPGANASERVARHSEAGRVLTALREIPTPVDHRTMVIDQLVRRGVARGVAQWMATNLHAVTGGGYAWSFDLDALESLLTDYWRVDGFAFLEDPPAGLRIRIVRAERSDRWSEQEWLRVERLAGEGRLDALVVPAAAHWLHVDNPRGLLDLLTR